MTMMMTTRRLAIPHKLNHGLMWLYKAKEWLAKAVQRQARITVRIGKNRKPLVHTVALTNEWENCCNPKSRQLFLSFPFSTLCQSPFFLKRMCQDSGENKKDCQKRTKADREKKRKRRAQIGASFHFLLLLPTIPISYYLFVQPPPSSSIVLLERQQQRARWCVQINQLINSR